MEKNKKINTLTTGPNMAIWLLTQNFGVIPKHTKDYTRGKFLNGNSKKIITKNGDWET